ncbi:ABC transporter ATP-binding protein [Sedimenticola selenatireducens]|uniref:ABC transporter ATP-binding protein n=1 Tax=Sedimenticola selenatireducens TaxID=191960 RepID=A0A2N6CRF0_9GAMM|nr:ABC transporter ATP-binding protein [Sedimenticola selenatireducens]PLX59627.1 MAG: ABC transporter ATP-binding protein [Sedimenticola selenatireducens]
MIKLENVSLSYPMESKPLQVLNAIELTIEEGETVAVLGPSGSGKTSLLLLLSGLEQPDAGIISLDGQTLSQLNPDQLADLRRDHLGIIFQSFHLVPSLTALGNVALPLEIAGKAGARQVAQQMLDKVGLAERQHHYPGQLSGGEQQRVAIARALVHRPKLVLADEPTGNLDIKTGEKVSRLLFELNQQTGSTLVVVTHDEAMARRCQRVVKLADGQLIETESTREATDALSA